MGGDGTAIRVALALAMRLNHSTGQCNPSHRTVARDCHLKSRDTVRKAIWKLVEAGLVEYAHTGGHGRQSTNQYRLKGCATSPLKKPSGVTGNTPKSRLRGDVEASKGVLETRTEPEGKELVSAQPICDAEDGGGHGKNVEPDACCVGALEGRTPQLFPEEKSPEALAKGRRAFAKIRADLNGARAQRGWP